MNPAQMTAVAVEGARTRRAMTFDEYLRWSPEGGLTEWVNGEGVQYVSTTKYHQSVIQLLVILLTYFVQLRRLGRIMTAPYSMRAQPDGNAREPDVFFVSQDRLHLMRETFLDGPADLVIEVVSDDSVTRDRVDKFDEYQEVGVKEYWVIDPRPGKQRALFFVLQDSQFIPARPDDAGIYRSAVLNGLELNVSWLWNETPDIPAILAQLT